MRAVEDAVGCKCRRRDGEPGEGREERAPDQRPEQLGLVESGRREQRKRVEHRAMAPK